MKKIILFTALLISLAGCIKNIDLYSDVNFQHKLVVNSLLFPGDTIKVYVSQTEVPEKLSYDDFISDAKVQIYDNGELRETLNYQDTTANIDYDYDYDPYPYYYTDFVAEEGHTYKIKVEALGQTIEKEVTFPTKVTGVSLEITSLNLDTIYHNAYNYFSSPDIKITINDPPEKNYYMFYFYDIQPDYYFDTTTYEYTDSIIGYYKNEPFFDLSNDFTGMQYISGELPVKNIYSYIIPDETFNGESFVITGNLHLNLNPDTTILHYVVYNLSEDLYRFIVTAQKSEMSQYNPFVEPVNVYSNIEGDNYGMITAVNFYEDSLTIVTPQ